MIIEKSERIIEEISKVLVGKDDVIAKVLMCVYANGHILLEDMPGVGKTTLALALSKVLGLDYKRIQFTPDTMPSDIVGFSMYDNKTNDLTYKPGAANCNLLLGDEINRTSPKTQSALLEVMEEGSATVDGITHLLPKPFICLATQNPVGYAGTHPLPESQLDRFMVCLSIGYPSSEDQLQIVKDRNSVNPLDTIKSVVTKDDIREIQNYLSSIKISDDNLKYIIDLCEKTRNHELVELGVSPRGVIALSNMVKARAILNERTYVIPEDIQALFGDVCAHRLVLNSQAKIENISAKDILNGLLQEVKPPKLGK